MLFGPETPKLYQPLGNARAIYAGLACSPCVTAHNHRKTACTDNVCMRAIAVNQVYVAVTDILSAPSAAQERRQAREYRDYSSSPFARAAIGLGVASTFSTMRCIGSPSTGLISKLSDFASARNSASFMVAA